MCKRNLYWLVFGLLIAVAAPVQVSAETFCSCLNHPTYNKESCLWHGYQWVCTELGPTEEELAAMEAAAEAEAAAAAAEARAAEEARQKAEAEAFDRQNQQSVEGAEELTTDLIRDAGVKVVRNIVSHVRTVTHPGPTALAPAVTSFDGRDTLQMTGLSAGGEASKFGVWFNPSYSWLDSDRSGSEYDGDAFLAMGGIDYEATPKVLIGLALGYEDSDLDTDYNGGTFESNGFTLAPYLAINLMDNLSFDAVAAFSWLDNDVTRTTNRGDLSGSYDSDRYMVSVNINYYRLVNNWNLSATAGYLYTNEDQDSYEESGDATNTVDDADVHLGEWRIGGRVGYFINAAEPYCSLAYLYDTSRSDSSGDRNEMEGILGLNYYPTDQFICSAEVRNSFFRSDFNSTEFMVNLRYAF